MVAGVGHLYGFPPLSLMYGAQEAHKGGGGGRRRCLVLSCREQPDTHGVQLRCPVGLDSIFQDLWSIGHKSD